MSRKHRSPAQRAATLKMLAANRRRKRSNNPSSRKATHRTRRRYANPSPRHHRRRRYHNPSTGGRGLLSELMSLNGVVMVGAAALASPALELVNDKLIPAQFKTGWTGLLARAVVAGVGVFALDYAGRKTKVRALRYAAVGGGIGAFGNLLLEAYKTVRVQQALPQAVTQQAPAVGEEIVKNPSLYKQLMEQGPYDSLNEYVQTPGLGEYAETPGMGGWNSFDSLN